MRGRGGRPLLEIISPAQRIPIRGAAGIRLRTSRFAILRAAVNALVIEAPGGSARLGHPGIAAVIAALAEPGLPEDLDTSQLGDLDAAELSTAVDWLAGMQILVDPETEDSDPILAVREPHDVWFHARSRLGHANGPLGGTRRFADSGITAIPPVPDRDVQRWQELTAPDFRTGPDFYALLDARRSRRRFGPVSLPQLSELLWRTVRVMTVNGGDGVPLTRRPVASGGASHDLELFAAVGRCTGLDSGLWWYDATRHRLGLISADKAVTAGFLLDAGAAMRAQPPPVTLLMSSRFARTSWKYEGMAYALTLKHVGVIMATIGLTAEALGLAACPLGSGNSARFEEVARTHPLAESTVGEIALGGPATRSGMDR